MKDKLIAKIKALLNRTVENGASLYEAEVALKKANELITKHHISEFELNNYSQKEDCKEIKIKFLRRSNHIKNLFHQVAKTFECEYCYTSSYGLFFGYETDLTIAEYIFNFCITSLEYEIKEYKKTLDYKDDIMVFSPNQVVNSFIGGFVNEITKKLKSLKSEKEEIVQTSTGTNLICLKNQAIVKSFELAHKDVKVTILKIAPSLKSAYDNGIESAKGYNLNRPIEKQNDNIKLIGA